jgi:hypothetical protein
VSSHNRRATWAKAAEREFRGDNAACPWCHHRIYDRWAGRKVFLSGSNEAKRALRKGRAKVVSYGRGWPSQGAITVDRVVCSHPCHEQ